MSEMAIRFVKPPQASISKLAIESATKNTDRKPVTLLLNILLDKRYAGKTAKALKKAAIIVCATVCGIPVNRTINDANNSNPGGF
jgi:hypothetical protein